MYECMMLLVKALVIKSSDPHLNFSCKKDDICMYQKVLKNGFIVKLA